MMGSRIILVAWLCLLSGSYVLAQRSKVTKSRQHFSAPKVKGSKARIVCPVFVNSKYPFHTLGLKIGDPFAATYKFYAHKRLSFALDLGKPASGLYRDYYAAQFTPEAVGPESTVSYISHTVKSDIVAELKALYRIDASRIVEGLQLYAGAGWEWKRSRLSYDYMQRDPLQPGDPFGSIERTWETMGPQISVGVEYSYFTIPVVAFMEVEVFTDVYADPGWQRVEGGVGVRYKLNQ